MDRYIYQLLKIYIFNFAYKHPDIDKLLSYLQECKGHSKLKKLLVHSQLQLQGDTKTTLT